MVQCADMSINVEIVKSGTENSLSVIRKFTRKMQGTQIVQNSRKNRYFARQMSDTVKRKKALKRIGRTAKYNQLLKEGKIQEEVKKRGGSRSQA